MKRICINTSLCCPSDRWRQRQPLREIIEFAEKSFEKRPVFRVLNQARPDRGGNQIWNQFKLIDEISEFGYAGKCGDGNQRFAGQAFLETEYLFSHSLLLVSSSRHPLPSHPPPFHHPIILFLFLLVLLVLLLGQRTPIHEKNDTKPYNKHLIKQQTHQSF